MSVKPADLDNQERGIDLSNREGERALSKRENLAAELKAFRDRLEAARVAERSKILRNDKRPHCGDCFTRGWTAAVAAIEGDTAS